MINWVHKNKYDFIIFAHCYLFSSQKLPTHVSGKTKVILYIIDKYISKKNINQFNTYIQTSKKKKETTTLKWKQGYYLLHATGNVVSSTID